MPPNVIVTEVPSLTGPGLGGDAALITRPLARRIAPPRETTWEVQRIRLSLSFLQSSIPSQPKYLVYSGFTTGQPSGVYPVCGVWKNNIAPDNEVLWIGCVSPGKSTYEPQMPVIIGESDSLICAVADAAATTIGQWNTTLWSIRFSFDVDERYKENT